MPHVLGVAALEVRDPMLLVVLMKSDDPSLGHAQARWAVGRTAGPRNSMYVDTGISVVKPNFS